MAQVKVYSKQNSTWYVYESHSYRDPVTKKPRSTKKLIGKLDADGNLVPTRKKGDVALARAEKEGREGEQYRLLYEQKSAELERTQREVQKLNDQISELKAKLKKFHSTAKRAETILQSLHEDGVPQ